MSRKCNRKDCSADLLELFLEYIIVARSLKSTSQHERFGTHFRARYTVFVLKTNRLISMKYTASLEFESVAEERNIHKVIDFKS